MGEFDFISILISIIIGLGVTNLLSGAGRAFYRTPPAATGLHGPTHCAPPFPAGILEGQLWRKQGLECA
jgi:hypothetical protein